MRRCSHVNSHRSKHDSRMHSSRYDSTRKHSSRHSTIEVMDSAMQSHRNQVDQGANLEKINEENFQAQNTKSLKRKIQSKTKLKKKESASPMALEIEQIIKS